MTDINNKPQNSYEKDTNPEKELELLRREKSMREKISGDVDRLWELFPNINIDELPDSIWDKVSAGESLLGAYCIHLAENNLTSEKAKAKNEKNSAQTPPTIKGNGEKDEFFTRETVSKMSRDQVRKNYDAILASMKRW